MISKLVEKIKKISASLASNFLSLSTRRKLFAAAFALLAIVGMLFVGTSPVRKIYLTTNIGSRLITNVRNFVNLGVRQAAPEVSEINEQLLRRIEATVPRGALFIVDSKHPLTRFFIKKEVEPDLIYIKENYPNIRVVNEKTQINQVCGENLNAMLIAAENEGVVITIRSAYRSFDQQLLAYKKAADKKVVTKPGVSQHHTGLAIDFTSPEIGDVVDINSGFGNTKAGKWLMENAWQYGFVLSYTNNHDGIKNEDWHYYYIGKDLAEVWHDKRQVDNRYDLFALQSEFSFLNSPEVGAAVP